MQQPTLTTERLLLRAFESADAHQVQRLAGNADVSSTTANIPHPYPDGLAEKWISTHGENFANQSRVTYAICLKENGELIGCISLIHLSSEHPELGYWLGVEHWGRGYCTEACREMIKFCIERFSLKAIYGKHLSRNPASGHVMEKCGLTYIGSDTGKDGFMLAPEEFRIYRMLCE